MVQRLADFDVEMEGLQTDPRRSEQNHWSQRVRQISAQCRTIVVSTDRLWDDAGWSTKHSYKCFGWIPIATRSKSSPSKRNCFSTSIVQKNLDMSGVGCLKRLEDVVLQVHDMLRRVLTLNSRRLGFSVNKNKPWLFTDSFLQVNQLTARQRRIDEMGDLY